jgi:valyl-tRNA synthetase
VPGGRLEGFLPLAGLVDLDAERARLDKAIAVAEADLVRVEAKLGNPSFLERAPADVVEKEQRKRSELAALREALAAQRVAL